ncbi:cytochrome P450 [Brevibacillus dissolubilis]|uniref:cytochrome P450 n=1 Tax=Brevibacillus dissolubilis TaxID=1844116 RepID=UPI00159B8D97|nr:cytochrome P450 [Brevibacillus dissolubilis]
MDNIHVTVVGGSRLKNYLHFRRDPIDFLIQVRDLADAVKLYDTEKRPPFVINSPELIREILVSKDSYFRKGRSSRILGMTLDNGLLTSEGAVHEEQRRMMMPGFHKQQIAGYAEHVVEYSRRLVDTFSDGANRSMTDDMMNLTLGIINKTMFNTDTADATHELAKAVEVCIEFSANRLLSPVSIPHFLPTRWNRKHKEAVQLLDQAIYRIIQKARDEYIPEQNHLLAMLIEAIDGETGRPLSDQAIRNQVLTIMIAGHETTANALSWAWYLLAKHPEVEQKFWQELDDVLGDRDPEFDDFQKLTYTQQIVQESLRLYPAAWVILREANQDVEMCGYHFPIHSSMIICPFAIHRNPAYFSDPDSFIPERFAGEEIKNIPRFAFFPFGGGSRSCIGSHFAMMEAVLILATIGKRYQLQLLPDQPPVEPEPLVSLRIRNGLTMRVSRRT